MITEDYVGFESAKLLKEKGFDEECSCFYNNIDYGTPGLEVDGQLYYKNSALDDEEYATPTLQMTMKWLREVHSYNIEIDTLGMMELNNLSWRSAVIYLVNENECYCEHGFDSYEEACEAAIRYTLENLI